MDRARSSRLVPSLMAYPSGRVQSIATAYRRRAAQRERNPAWLLIPGQLALDRRGLGYHQAMPGDVEPLVLARGLTKQFGASTAVDAIDFERRTPASRSASWGPTVRARRARCA